MTKTEYNLSGTWYERNKHKKQKKKQVEPESVSVSQLNFSPLQTLIDVASIIEVFLKEIETSDQDETKQVIALSAIVNIDSRCSALLNQI